jgi:hypothetical protein
LWGRGFESHSLRRVTPIEVKVFIAISFLQTTPTSIQQSPFATWAAEASQI